ncbi:hypothetical protein [Actinoplanes sp. NPDC026670]|uniref:hypothetical protein n=1 Tax=Actinoplanes sp. NPDC026670 TaxID=3154700 RepID=UPI0033E274F0
MSGNGSPAHRAPSSVQRNRLIAVGAGVALLVILLFALLAYCTQPDDPGSTTADPGSSVSAPADGSAPPPNGGGEAAPAPSAGTPGEDTPGESTPGAPEESTPGTPTEEVTTADPTGGPGGTGPEQTSTPAGGVDAGGGSQTDGRRLALLVTGGFLLVAAAVVGTYAIRRPLHHR